jgi:hypothetical protein
MGCIPASCRLDIGSLAAALAALAATSGVRLQTLARGGQEALDWIDGRTAAAPLLALTGREVHDVARVTAAAGLLSAGVRWVGLPPVTDAMRIYARGVEDVLGWWLHPDAPLPPWTDGSASEADLVRRCVGLVGADLAAAGWGASDHELPRWLSFV